MTVIGLWICFGLLAIGIIALIASGIRGLVSGGVNRQKVAAMTIPVVIWVVALIVTGSWVTSGLVTALIMLVLMFIAMTGTGLRGMIG